MVTPTGTEYEPKNVAEELENMCEKTAPSDAQRRNKGPAKERLARAFVIASQLLQGSTLMDTSGEPMASSTSLDRNEAMKADNAESESKNGSNSESE